MTDLDLPSQPVLRTSLDGELARHARQFDWSATRLGPAETWSPSLKLAVGVIMANPFPMALRWGPHFVLIYNDGYAPILGDRHPRAFGQPFDEAWPELRDDLAPLHQAILDGVQGGVFREDLPLTVRRRGDRLEQAHFTISYSPVPDDTAPSGVGGVLITAIETTERLRTEQALRARGERYELALGAAGGVGTWDLNLQTGAMTWSDRCKAMFGLPPEATVTLEDFYAGLHPADREATIQACAEAVDPTIRANYDLEHRAIGRADGVERWIATTGKALFDEAGQPLRAIGTMVNITERKRAELHLRLMVNELNHRVKNSLATIQAIAAQTFGGAHSLPEAQDAFASRIIALADAHDILTRENWEGADIEDLARRTAALHGGEDRFELSGPAIRLSPRAALSLSMALHELATNALKYGALSAPEGRVAVNWSLTKQAAMAGLTLVWSERGGPPVTAPARKGFGSRLIERGLAAELSGRATITYEASGVVCRIEAPLGV